MVFRAFRALDSRHRNSGEFGRVAALSLYSRKLIGGPELFIKLGGEPVETPRSSLCITPPSQEMKA
jgi:hypothetical protein